MSSILLVERSATLRFAVAALLRRQGHEVTPCDSYEVCLQKLKNTANSKFEALVIGFPPHHHPAAEELLRLSKTMAYLQMPLVVFAHVAETEVLEWVARRKRTALLLWDDYADCASCIEKLFTAEKGANPIATELKEETRILFVDDSRTVRASFGQLLRDHGYLVEVASNVTEAVDKANESPFDIAIIDYFMPGQNGDVLCRKLRDNDRTNTITTAILTGTYSDEVIKETLEAGAVECMFKNEAKELFLARIDAMSRFVSARKSIEAERQRLESILTSVGDGVYGVNTSGQISFINPAARKILGLHESDVAIIGRPAYDMFHHVSEDGKPVSKEGCLLQQAYSTGNKLEAWETIFLKQQGTLVPVECTVYPLRSQDHLEGSVVAFRDITERRILERELLWQANHDALTKLHNRNYFEQQLEEEVNRTKRTKETSALLYIDLDRFKYINDTAGHAAGDQLLIEISRQLESRLRSTDLLARLGGDEFAIILRSMDKDCVETAAESFREVLEQYHFSYGGKSHKVNGSIGVALIDITTASAGDVLANADIACHVAKGRGRNQTHIYEPESDEKIAMNAELGWSARLQDALQNDHFALYYQPIVSIDSLGIEQLPPQEGELWRRLVNNGHDQLIRYEVLVRLADSDSEPVSPNAFLPTAERFGIMPQIDEWVITHALEQLSILKAQGQRVSFSINISGQTLELAHFSRLIKDILNKYDVPTDSLVFEITETSAVENIGAVQMLMSELRELGCRFALDDFGSGFSSFIHLKHLHADFIKIDGQFIQGLATDATDRAIVTSINDIAHSFGKYTIAEFVEDPTTLILLKRYGVNYAQGNYISSPFAELPHLGLHKVVSN